MTSGKNSITEGVIWKSLLAFSLPILFSSFLQQLYGTVDTIIVGRFCGDEALAAVGATGSLTNMLIGLFLGLATGAGVVISHNYGAKNDDGVSKAAHTAVAVALAGGVFLILLGTLFARPMLLLIRTPPDVIDLSTAYLTVIFSGMLFNMLYNVGSGILRAVGDSRRPLLYLVVSTAVNVVLDLLLVGRFRMGITGAALATVLSQGIASVLSIRRLMTVRDTYRISLRKIRFDGKSLARIVRIGVPSGLQAMSLSFSNVLVQRAINSFGSAVMAAWTAYSRLDNFPYLTVAALGMALTTFVGQNTGAGRIDRVKNGVRDGLGMMAAASVTIGAAGLLWGRAVLGLFTDSAEVVEYGVLMSRFLFPLYWIYGTIEVLSGAIRGMGKAFLSMTVGLCGLCGLRIVYILAVGALTHDIRALMGVYPTTWVITAAAFILCYRLAVRRLERETAA